MGSKTEREGHEVVQGLAGKDKMNLKQNNSKALPRGHYSAASGSSCCSTILPAESIHSLYNSWSADAWSGRRAAFLPAFQLQGWKHRWEGPFLALLLPIHLGRAGMDKTPLHRVNRGCLGAVLTIKAVC